jgi:hypothetical protein
VNREQFAVHVSVGLASFDICSWFGQLADVD